MYNYTGPDEIVSITEYTETEKNKNLFKQNNPYLVEWYVKDEPKKETNRFKTYAKAQAFIKRLYIDYPDGEIICDGYITKVMQ